MRILNQNHFYHYFQILIAGYQMLYQSYMETIINFFQKYHHTIFKINPKTNPHKYFITSNIPNPVPLQISPHYFQTLFLYLYPLQY